MKPFHRLRRLYYRLRKSISPHRSPRPYLPGLPFGIEPETVDAVCRQFFGERVSSIAFQHLSGWKSSGAYRLMCKTTGGNAIPLIFKNAYYAKEQIPALIDLPVHPGPPEYAIFSQPVGPLKKFLPAIYLAEEIVPGAHYRYLLEDLGVHYHITRRDEDIIAVCEWLPQLQQALSAWTAVANTDGLIVYDRSYTSALQEYVRAKLEGYREHAENAALQEVLTLWPKISQLHLDPAFCSPHLDPPIHGDANFTNLHLHKDNKYQLKVVDWEWAGFGSPFCDLASLLKGKPEEVERMGVRAFASSYQQIAPCEVNDLSPEASWRFYLWSKLERSLLDAAFLSAQHINTIFNTGFSLPGAVNHALLRVLSTYRQLTDTPDLE